MKNNTTASKTERPLRIIISGGGTGGHIFPAIAIANALKELQPTIEILFVGAEGRIEMERVPQAGYNIEGLPVTGFARRLTIKNLAFGFKLLKSLGRARRILNRFRPDAAVGVGGYASGPMLYVATRAGVPALVQEQNSYPGVTNRLLAKRVQKICVAYDDMENFFPTGKIIKTGNPVRKELFENTIEKTAALEHFGLSAKRKTIFVFGGSGGARSVNQGVLQQLGWLAQQTGVQVVLQSGKYYYEEARKTIEQAAAENVQVRAFISRMDMAYAAADVVVARAGAGTISELYLVKKPVILVPSPNVAADHQTKNAMALVNKQAAVMVKDHETTEKMMKQAVELLHDTEKQAILTKNIAQMAMHEADTMIAKEVLKLTGKNY